MSRSRRRGGQRRAFDKVWHGYLFSEGLFFPAAQQMVLIKGKQPLTEQCGTIQSLTEPLVCLVFLRPATVSQRSHTKPCQLLDVVPPLA